MEGEEQLNAWAAERLKELLISNSLEEIINYYANRVSLYVSTDVSSNRARRSDMESSISHAETNGW